MPLNLKVCFQTGQNAIALVVFLTVQLLHMQAMSYILFKEEPVKV